MKIKIKNIVITLLVGFIYFYFALPPLNVTSMAFWFFVSLLLIIYFVLELSDGLMTSFQMITGKTLINRKKVDYSLFIPLSIAV
ncbi:MAG: hypothetical protein PHE54_01310, partial [Bacilli bacterium]|nr:hypothetical protein [Bacilli bacterium]